MYKKHDIYVLSHTSPLAMDSIDRCTHAASTPLNVLRSLFEKIGAIPLESTVNSDALSTLRSPPSHSLECSMLCCAPDRATSVGYQSCASLSTITVGKRLAILFFKGMDESDQYQIALNTRAAIRLRRVPSMMFLKSVTCWGPQMRWPPPMPWCTRRRAHSA